MIGPKPTHTLRARRASGRSIFVAGLTSLLAVVAVANHTRADGLAVRVEAGLALPVAAPQSRDFGVGGDLAAGVMLPIWPAFSVGAGLRGLLLSDKGGAPAQGRVDYGAGTLYAAELQLRLQPLAGADERHLFSGPFIDGSLGGGVTGDLPRGLFGAGLGYAIPIGSVALAPIVRYLQVIQVGNSLSNDDARVAMFGVELMMGNERPVVEQLPEPPPPPPPDSDGDGILDPDDACPEVAEDVDGFEDSDGCPELDNDGDGIEDTRDKCPDEPEDVDGFADGDGCPDPDNDMDGFLDADDQCPDDAEIVNGNKDYDGCPDVGLITFKDDRIVLEERVLFDLERARIKSAAKPVLRAIVELQRQHPEWIEIRIEGHADVRGDTDYNLKLSERRARNVRLQLVELGIPSKLMESRGYGATKLRDRGEDEEAHRRNRRVEFVVVTRSEPPTGPGVAPVSEVEGSNTPPSESPAPTDGGATAPATPAPALPPMPPPPSLPADPAASEEAAP